MGITVLLKAQTKEGMATEFKSFVGKCLTETRQYDGFLSIDIYEEKSKEGAFLFYENWESIQAYEDYLDWRTEQGVMEKMGAMLTTAPEIKYYDHVDI